jgi:PAS domain S-box-containing protein
MEILARRLSTLRLVSGMAGVAVALLGGSVLIGWALDIAALRSIAPGLVEMKANTASCFVLMGLGLVFAHFRKTFAVAEVCSFVVITVAIVTLSQYLTGRNVGLDEFLFGDSLSVAMRLPPGRMAFATAVAFVFGGTSLILTIRRRILASQFLILGALLIPLCSLLAYLYGERSITLTSPYTSLAINTAVGFAILGIGLLCACAEIGPMSVFVAEELGGTSLRRLLPISIFTTLVLGFASFLGARGGLSSYAAGMVLFAVVTSVALTVAIWAIGWLLNQAEMERLRSRDWLRQTLRSIGDAVIATDREGRVLFLNPAAEGLTGWESRQAEGLPLGAIFRVVDASTRQVADDPVERALSEVGFVESFDRGVLIARDGTDRLIDVSVAPNKDGRGVITGVVLVFQDVSGKRRAEHALAESEEFNRRIIESSTDCLKVLDLDGRIVSMNDFGCRLMEIDDFPPFKDKEWVEFWPEDSRSMARAALDRAKGGRIASFQGLCPTAKGTEKWWDVTVSPILAADGTTQRILSVSRDITDRRWSEEQLRRAAVESAQANAKFRAVFEQGAQFATVLSLDGTILEVNNLCLDPCGYTREEVLGRPFWDGGWWNRSPEQRALIEAATIQASKGHLFRAETPYFLADGSERLCELTITPVTDDEGRVLFIAPTGMDITDRKRGVEELREAEQRTRTVLGSITEGFVAVDSRWHFTYLNAQAERIYGMRREELLGKCFWVVFPEALGTVFEREYRRAMEHRVLARVEAPFDRLGGWFEVNVFPADDGGVSFYFRDITVRKRAEEERAALMARIALQARLFDAALSNTPDFLYSFDREGRFTYINQSLLSLLRRRFDEAVGKTFAELNYPSELAARLHRQILEVVATKAPVQDETPYTSVLGSRYYEYIFVPVLAPDGTVEAVAGSTRDITDRKRTEETTRRRAFQLQKLADIANRINTAHDVDSVVAIVTEEARALVDAHLSSTSILLEPLHPRPILAVSKSEKHPHRPPPPMEGLRIVQTFRKANEPVRLTRREMDSDPAWEEIGNQVGVCSADNGWLAAPLMGRNGRIIGMIQVSDKDLGDFTADDEAILVQLSRLAAVAIENARLYQELRGNDERKDEFLAMLAHELRNPLAAIGNAVRLSSRAGANEHVEWSMGVITRQMLNLTRLIDDLMDVSRITRGKIELRRTVMDATPILESAAVTVGALVEERKHTFELILDRGGLWVDGDPTRLEQVVVNLLNNAAKYSENEGHILLSARREGGEVVIVVRDRGVGIPPEKIPAMFELFAQGDRSLARSEGGLGIGLTVVKKLVEMHGGAITARSDGPGQGSEFTIRLPAAKKPLPSGPTPADQTSSLVEKTRILVVDDNVDTARGMARLMTLIGHEVATAHSGPEAIELARKLRPQFVMLDIGLPGMNGYEVATQLRREECCKGAVIVAISGYGQDADRRRSKEAGIDHHLLKPLDHDALLALLPGGPSQDGPSSSLPR